MIGKKNENFWKKFKKWAKIGGKCLKIGEQVKKNWNFFLNWRTMSTKWWTMFEILRYLVHQMVDNVKKNGIPCPPFGGQ